jgi:large subunit ribosomal protein L23
VDEMNRERLLTIIKAPLITEKSSMLASNLNQVAFKVSLDANKSEIKKAVESLFDVKVKSVNTSISKGKTKRNRFGKYKRSDYKKAIVALQEGSQIQFEGIN